MLAPDVELSPRLPASHRGGILAGLAVVYFLAGKFGLTMAFDHPSATPVWPPTGISLAAFLLFGYWVWPAVFVGAFFVNLTTAGSWSTSFGIASGNTLEGIFGAYLVYRYAHGREVFARQRDMFLFVLLAAVLSTTMSATVGVSSLALGGYASWETFRRIWVTWWLGDVAGALLVTPVLVLSALQPTLASRRADRLEVVSLLAVLAAVTLIIFHSGPWPAYPLVFLTLPIMVWVAIRLPPRETATAILLCVAIAIWGTLRGLGPFVRDNPNETLLSLQTFMAVVAVTALVLAIGVAERREAEDALDQLNRTLERRIQDRTGTLQRAVEQLQELDRLKNAFVTIVSHELRTPLTSIKGFVENLAEGLAGPLTTKQQHYLARVLHNTDRLTRMLNELLNLSRIEAGRMELLPISLSVTRLLRDVIAGLHPLARQKSITVDLRAPTNLPAVRADRDRLYEIVSNLLENAIKFTPAGGRIQLSAESVDDHFIKVLVSDTGCGIAEEHCGKIFEKFYRAPGTPTGAEGTGLGLTIAKGLVELHGGTLTVESTPGLGSHFSFTLPYESPRDCDTPVSTASL